MERWQSRAINQKPSSNFYTPYSCVINHADKSFVKQLSHFVIQLSHFSEVKSLIKTAYKEIIGMYKTISAAHESSCNKRQACSFSVLFFKWRIKNKL